MKERKGRRRCDAHLVYPASLASLLKRSRSLIEWQMKESMRWPKLDSMATAHLIAMRPVMSCHVVSCHVTHLLSLRPR